MTAVRAGARPGDQLLRDQGFNAAAFDYYRRLGKVKLFVESNLARPIAVEQAADIAGLSPGYFSTFFRQKTGVRFTTWVTHLRVEEAKRRLASNNESITHLAYAAGYRDLRTFERAFKRCTDETPVAFKKRHRPS